MTMTAQAKVAAFKAHFVENWHEPFLLAGALLAANFLGWL